MIDMALGCQHTFGQNMQGIASEVLGEKTRRFGLVVLAF